MNRCLKLLLENEEHYIKLCRSYAKNYHDAQDIFQNLATKLSAMNVNPARGKEAAMLGVSLLNVVRDFHRKERKHLNPELVLEQVFDSVHSMSEDPMLVNMREQIEYLLPDLIDSLVNKETHKELLNMVFVEGLRPEVAQEALGISTSNRTTIINRFKEKVTAV